MKIELTNAQAKTIGRACEVCARLHMLQTDVLTDFADVSYGQQKAIKYIMQHPKNTLSYAPDDIRRKEKDVLFGIHQVLRHHLAWKKEKNTPATRDWNKQMGVCFDDPMPFGAEKLITILEE